MKADFVHLHLHTEYSIVDGTIRIPELMQRCAELGMPAVALTDQGNLFGLVKFYRSALRHGIKPVVGVDLRLADPDDADRPFSLTLLVQSRAGYRNLNRLITRTYVEGQHKGLPMARYEWFGRDSCAGLVGIAGGVNGDVGRALVAGHQDVAAKRLGHWQDIFGDRFYLEICRSGRPDEQLFGDRAVELASDFGAPLVAGNDVRFLRQEEFEAHEARVCIQQGRVLGDPDRPRLYTDQQYLKSPEEMLSLFHDIPEACANTVEIARRCSLDLKLGKSFLPAFPVPDGQTTDEYLRAESQRGLDRLLRRKAAREDSDETNAQHTAVYQARLDDELRVICEMGFSGYFLIVADFIDWAKKQLIPVGPGRGSGAGSLVAYVLGITDLDPLEHDLLFERFLNPERVSMPDFDVDFCMDGRDRVIEYVSERYGRDRVSQIITYGTMAARAVIRDAGRVLGHPYGFVDRIAKQVPFEIGITLDKALEQEDELTAMYRDDEEVRALIDLGKSLEGLVRNAGKHAGGVVIAPDKLTDFTPLYCEDGGSSAVTQFDKDDVEAAGLVKFDFLGLKTLTVIDRAVRIVNERAAASESIDIATLPMQDQKTFELLQRCDTTGVFQLESRGMRDLIKRLKPDHFDDLVALVALFRPGPLQSGMVDDFISRKHDAGKSEIDYLHPDIQSILEPTYGVILYQEQVMQIAQVLAGFTLGGADLLRRAMGKKKPEEMAKQREFFVGGACERGVAEATATRIFDLMEKFAGYGFNKSHSAAYALLSYQTAFLKAHYPAAFTAAAMSADLDNTDRLVMLKDDCRQLSLRLAAPDVNRSSYQFSVLDNQSILYGLGAVKGVGRAAVETIVDEREARGIFSDLAEFCRRVDLDKVNRRALEAMIKAGAMDSFGVSRRGLMEQLPEALQAADQEARAHAAGQNDMFGIAAESPAPKKLQTAHCAEWAEQEYLRNEKEALGLYLTGHPFDAVRRDAQFFVDGRLGDIAAEPQPQSANGERSFAQPKREITIAGLIMDVRKRGNRVTVVLDDDSGRLEVSLFSEAFQEFRHLLVKDEIVVVSGGLRFDEFMGAWQVNAKKILNIDRVIETRAKSMILNVAPNGKGQLLLTELHDVLLPYREGHCDVSVQYTGASAAARLALGPEWSVRPSRELREKLTDLLGRNGVRLLYTPGREIM
ncbi:MAG: DNA polymerase III subunit alpha [Gammaproteobacteria bacterium]|nr:DNA polymerase III subunit alpha [Gammaproteobacteria bacterium]